MDQAPTSNRLFILKRAVMLNCNQVPPQEDSTFVLPTYLARCNQVERLGTFCLMIFLGCASVFQEHDCGKGQLDEVCNSLDVLTFVIFLLAIAACLANPLRLGYLTLRDRSRPRTDFSVVVRKSVRPLRPVLGP